MSEQRVHVHIFGFVSAFIFVVFCARALSVESCVLGYMSIVRLSSSSSVSLNIRILLLPGPSLCSLPTSSQMDNFCACAPFDIIILYSMYLC